MPHKQFQIVEKIKFLLPSRLRSKKQIVDDIESNARRHRMYNQKQEREDVVRLDHANRQLKEERGMESRASSDLLSALGISISINIILVVVMLVLYFLF